MTIEVKRRIADQTAELVKTNAPQRQLELVGELAASLGDLLQAITGQPIRLQLTTDTFTLAVVEEPASTPEQAPRAASSARDQRPFRSRFDGGEQVCCASCNFPAPLTETEWPPGSVAARHGPRLICEFCSTTMASRHTEETARTDAGRAIQETWRAAAGVFHMLRGPAEPCGRPDDSDWPGYPGQPTATGSKP